MFVAPWVLEQQSKQWVYRAITAQGAERWAEDNKRPQS